MGGNLPRRSIVGLLALALLGCEGAPCPDNDDATCLTEATARVCNMAVPAADPEQGTCRAPAELNGPCAETADCAAGACSFFPYSGPCSEPCCHGECLLSPVCMACAMQRLAEYHGACFTVCCGFNCPSDPACQACMSSLGPGECKALAGEACERDRDCGSGWDTVALTCFEAENRCVEMGPGSPCDDAADCSGDLACNPATHLCEAPAAG